MTARPAGVYVETGARWVFACAVDWPGWCRRAKGEDAAIEALLEYAPRYRAAVGTGFRPIGVQVVGRVEGNATTDFGAPAAFGPGDFEALFGRDLERQVGILESCWQAFDGVVARAPARLRKGPRGGGRDLDQIVVHVRDAERAYGPKAGTRVPPGTPWPEQRRLIAAGLRNGAPGARWPARYALRRLAWHVLDHAWEIEDRRDP